MKKSQMREFPLQTGLRSTQKKYKAMPSIICKAPGPAMILSGIPYKNDMEIVESNKEEVKCTGEVNECCVVDVS